MGGGEKRTMVKHSAKVFGYVDQSVKERIAKLREINARLTESRLVDEGLAKVLDEYEAQLNPLEPAQRAAKKLRDS